MSISGKTHTCGHTPIEKWPICLLVKGHEGEHESVNYAWSDNSTPWLKNPSALADAYAALGIEGGGYRRSSTG